MSRSWTLIELLRWTTDFFAQHGIDSARLDAEVLLAEVLSMSRLDLYLSFDQPVSAADRTSFRELVRRRAKQRTPVAYLLERREFWSLEIGVTPDVLIPRPETELLVQVVRDLAPGQAIEIGVGSGCVLAALAQELPEARLMGVEVSEAALKVAQRNLEQLGMADRVELRHGDGLRDVRGPFDLVLSNPPYIPTEDIDALSPEVQQEPRIALDGGPDGLDVVRSLIERAPAVLARPGRLVLELGAGQSEEVADLLRLAGASQLELHPDLAGVERVIVATWDAPR